jgi:hypothetical protein
MLQRSVVDSWVQPDHILLIHSCPETIFYALGILKYEGGRPYPLSTRLTGDIYLTFLKETLPDSTGFLSLGVHAKPGVRDSSGDTT